MQKITLQNKFWNCHEGSDISIDFIGYIDFEGSLLLKAHDLTFILASKKIEKFKLFQFLSESFFPKANGNFALIVRTKSWSIIACDFSRNYPLYIIKNSSEIIITDHIGEIIFEKIQDQLAEEEFLLSGLVTGNRTVFKNVKSLQAGEMAIISESEMNFHRYFILNSDPCPSNTVINRQSIYHEMDMLLLNTFSRMINSCPKVRNWIVPLSGGHDSRLIINYLYRLGCKNVICFSYGIASSREAEISKTAAEVLGYKWYFVDYTPEKWEELHSSKIFDRYIKYSFNGCNLPHTQDLLAIHILKGNGVIGDNDVIVPGHSAFTEAECLLIKDLNTDRQSLKFVFDKYYNLFKCENQFTRFEANLRQLFQKDEQTIYSFPVFFNWQERQAKFINNSVRAYEFYGLQWRLPLWEKDVINFWQKLSFDDRIGRKILFEASKEFMFHDLLKNIPILNKFQKPTSSKRNYLNLFPDRYISLIVRMLGKITKVDEGTNLVFALKARSIKGVISPISMYPSNLKRYFIDLLPRRPYQVNVNSLIAIFTLHNEVFSEFANNQDE